jgi:hypothetical protein
MAAADEELMHAYAGGDATAFEALYGRHRPLSPALDEFRRDPLDYRIPEAMGPRLKPR